MNVNGQTIEVVRVGRVYEAQAFDATIGRNRTYTVDTYRARGGAFTAELWTRGDDNEDDGGDCSSQLGGLTVRKGGRQTQMRIQGFSCTLF